jgi:hypothetical protein
MGTFVIVLILAIGLTFFASYINVGKSSKGNYSLLGLPPSVTGPALENKN